MRMNTVSRQDGLKEKRAELTLSRLHPLGGGAAPADPFAGSAPPPRAAAPSPMRAATRPASPASAPPTQGPPVWNTSPLVPDDAALGDDDIPF
jgi:hypothetical protein